MANKTEIDTEIENEGFHVKVLIEEGSVKITIDDKDRDVFSSISGISVISIYKDDDFIRISSDHKICNCERSDDPAQTV